MNDGVLPTLRMVAAIYDHVERFFAESDCPLTEAQRIALDDARRVTSQVAADAA